ncbi:MAG: DUF1294 domain-containing protein [Oscillospiraceae bacterium]
MGLFYYLAGVNLLCFFLMGADKYKARRRQWRIPEKVLLGTALLGGSLGGLLGMYLFRHKTNHPPFRYGLPALLGAHCLLILWYFR